MGNMIVTRELENEIVRVVRRLGRSRRKAISRTVIIWLDVDCSERTVRRYMARMAETGRLMRIGQRMGYGVVRAN